MGPRIPSGTGTRISCTEVYKPSIIIKCLHLLRTKLFCYYTRTERSKLGVYRVPAAPQLLPQCNGHNVCTWRQLKSSLKLTVLVGSQSRIIPTGLMCVLWRVR